MVTTIRMILTQIARGISQQSETPLLDAQVLVAHLLNKPRAWVLAHPEASINENQYMNLIQALERLEDGEPLPYVIGSWDFFGLDFNLTHDVLIPRPETEQLVERAISWLKDHPNRRKAVDVGTGSGCIGVSLAMHILDLSVLMTDISPKALNIARLNADKFGLSGRLEFRQLNLLEDVVEHFDLIIANLPYIPGQLLNELPVSDWEPLIALDGGKKGTELIGGLLIQARNCLVPGGLLLLEIESSHAAEVLKIASDQFPAARIEVRKDLSGHDRCLEILSSRLLVHLCHREQWQKAQDCGSFIANSLAVEGFIHCSQPQQILQVANTFYRNFSDLVLIWIDPENVTSKITWEAVEGALFPHIYGPINLDSVVAVSDFRPDEAGIFRKIELPG